MSHRARHQLLALPGIIFLVLFPIILSLWIAGDAANLLI